MKTNRKREPERIQKGSDWGRKIFALIGMESARSKREKKNKN